jgi:filamentous hemagglutinin
VEAVANVPQAAGEARGGAGFTGVSAVSAGLQAASAVYKAILQVVSASVEIGASQSRQKSSATASTAAPSSVSAGRNLDVFAGRNIFIEGGRLVAVGDMTLDAGRDLTITAAKNHWEQSSSSSNQSASVGVSVGFGAAGWNVSAYAAASAGGSQAGADGMTHTNALVLAGGKLQTRSGRDTNVRGANLAADEVAMDVGGNLNVASLQDTSSMESSFWSVGGGINMGLGNFFDLPELLFGLPLAANSGGISGSLHAGYGEGWGDSL